MNKMILKGITTAILGALMISAAMAQTTTGGAKPAGSKPPVSASAAKSTTMAASAATDLLDLNTAPKSELMKLPGITDADAAKIIAGRPYKMKSQLKSSKVISDAQYAKISALVIAKQPAKK
jgi:DNA uptake protein ComE-like DNA-binding protein